MIAIGNVVGDSMEPTIKDGDQIMIDTSERVSDGDIAIVEYTLSNGRRGKCIKRVYRDGDGWKLVSVNPAHKPFTVTHDQDLVIIGKYLARFVWD